MPMFDGPVTSQRRGLIWERKAPGSNPGTPTTLWRVRAVRPAGPARTATMAEVLTLFCDNVCHCAAPPDRPSVAHARRSTVVKSAVETLNPTRVKLTGAWVPQGQGPAADH
jgi:hypothetical protein